MEERTFRAVVASVLVGALVLAAIVVIAVYLPRSATPAPSTSTVSPSPGPTLAPAPTPSPEPVLAAPAVVGVGDVARGATSAPTLVLKFIERRFDAVPNAPGSFRLTLADQAGDGLTVAFVGTPVVHAPGSLGATATLVGPNAILISITGADAANVEPITITGLGIRALPKAALGPMTAKLGAFDGSLATGSASLDLPSPGTVVAGP